MAGQMSPADATSLGYRNGEEFAGYALDPAMSVGSEFKVNAGCDCDRDNEKIWCRDCVESSLFEAEENARQLADFANGIASAFNKDDDPETLWDAYEEGFTLGLREKLDKILLPDRLFPMATESARVLRSRHDKKTTKRSRSHP